MRQLVGGGVELAWVVLKAMLLYVTAVFCFRVGRRRTIAEMSPYDFVAAVAVGAIVGWVPNSSDTSYLAGTFTLVSILSLHALLTRLRYSKMMAPAIDHRPRLLLVDGRLQKGELRRCGLTDGDLFSLLRQHGITDTDQVAYVIFEQRGEVSVIRSDPSLAGGRLVREVVEQARGGR